MKLKSRQNAKAELINRQRCKVGDPFALPGHAHIIVKQGKPLFFSYHGNDGSSGVNEIVNGANDAEERKAKVMTVFMGEWRDGSVGNIKKRLGEAAEAGCLGTIVGTMYEDGKIEDLIRIAKKAGCLGSVLKGAHEEGILVRVVGTMGQKEHKEIFTEDKEIILEAHKAGLINEIKRLFDPNTVGRIIVGESGKDEYI